MPRYARRQNISLPEHTRKTRNLLPLARLQNARNDCLKPGTEAAEFLRGWRCARQMSLDE